ncbi:MAG: diguanylate cyclase, partial [Acidobacteriota bacterium]
VERDEAEHLTALRDRHADHAADALGLEPLHIPDVHHLPPAASRERADFEAKGIRGVVRVPVAQRGEMLGFVAFDSLRQPRIWPDASLTLLKILGEILANALVRRRAADALAAERERALVTLGAIGDGVIRTDAHGRIDYLNPVAARLTGWSDADARGRSVPEVYRVLSEASRRARRDPVALCLAQRRTVTLPGLGTLLSRDGRECTVRDVVSPIVDARGRLLGTVLAFKDLTEMRGLEREMAYLASHDPLTGLLNRSEFEIHLEAALESAREEAVRHALLFIDLHQFKLVNDACGHVAGDELLRQVARLLQEVVGESGVVGRLGGDEFGVLLEKVSSSEARTVANAIQRVLRENRFDWGGQHFDIEATLGIVPITVASDSVIQILKAADAACYLARDSTNRIHETIPDDRALSKRYVEVQMVHRIRRAIEEDRFLLHAQRIEPTDPESGKMAFHEILLRMIDERGEMVSPGVFIPLAERYQLGPMLDRWVVRRVLRLLRR